MANVVTPPEFMVKKKKVKVLYQEDSSRQENDHKTAEFSRSSEHDTSRELRGTPPRGATACTFTSPDSGLSSEDGQTPIKPSEQQSGHSAFKNLRHPSKRQPNAESFRPVQFGPSAIPCSPSGGAIYHMGYTLPPPVGIIPNYTPQYFLASVPQISPFQYTSFINYGYSMYHRCLQDGVKSRPVNVAASSKRQKLHYSPTDGADSVDGLTNSESSLETANDDDRDSPIVVDDDYQSPTYGHQTTGDHFQSPEVDPTPMTSTPLRETPRLTPKQLELTVATPSERTHNEHSSISSASSGNVSNHEQNSPGYGLWSPMTSEAHGSITALPGGAPGIFFPLVPAIATSRRNEPRKSPPERKYKCDVCEKSFSRSNTLVTHKRIHTGAKPFSCDQCGRAFRQPGNLTRHKMTHTAHKPYVCAECGKAFNRASNLQTHMRTHTNHRPFLCPYCGKGFHQKIDMKIHCYTHTGEKPHKCAICGRGFKQLTHVTYHMRTHSDNKEFTCPVCERGFNQKGNLQTHLLTHNSTDSTAAATDVATDNTPE